MTGFSTEWLTLREAADDRARDADLMAEVARRFDGALIADLGGGTGATLRVLGPRLPAARWRILDADAALLSHVEPTARVEPVEVDLAAEPEAAFASRPALITASAFFDLTSAAWIDRFASLLKHSGGALYAALTYDGREVWTPAPPHEARALKAFHADMGRDKGFGPALGPNAADALSAALGRAGLKVMTAKSDWRLSRPEDGAMIDALADGGAAALAETMTGEDGAAWADGRRAAQDVLVGHVDILALPA